MQSTGDDKHSEELRAHLIFFFGVPLTDVYLKLGGWKVYIRDHFSAGMFHLQTRIQLQEMEPSIFREEVLHGTRTHVAHHLS